MTDRELMQQALEALNRSDYLGWQLNIPIIKALRERLAQPEPIQFKCTVVDDDHPDGVPLSKWGRHPDQEPFCYHDGRNIVGKEYAHHSDVFPLYTSPPPAKPWVGLTDEDLFDIASVNFGEPDLQLFIEMGRLVQEELKEKNA